MRHLPALFAILLATVPLTLAAEEDEHLSEAHGLRIVHAWTNATEGDAALVYAEIENAADADRVLLGVESDAASGAMLVGFALESGETREIVLPELRIAPGTHLDLSPGEVAIRLEGLTTPLTEGEHLDVALMFDVGSVEIEVSVEAEDATAHGHTGHMH
jgi:copper(I)-binding protein